MIETIDCRSISDKVLADLQRKIKMYDYHITLAVVRAGNDPSSLSYLKKITNFCEFVGIHCMVYPYPEYYTTEELIARVKRLNSLSEVTGIMVQLPLPDHMDAKTITEAITPEKDVDGITTSNMGKLASHTGDYFIPCTAKAVIKILDNTYTSLDGLDIAVFGRSNTVGKPLALELMNRNATVEVIHSKSLRRPIDYSFNKDIVISAMGQPHKLATKDIGGCTDCVIDCGVTMVNGKLQGDVDLDKLAEYEDDYELLVTKVPGGVGTVTTAMLMENLVEAHERQLDKFLDDMIKELKDAALH